MTGVLYASLLELKQSLQINDEDNDVDLERALDAACRKIDGECGRTFSLATAATKLYYPDSVWQLPVLDLVSITTMKKDTYGDRTYATTFASTDYELWPLTGPPYQEVRAWPRGSTLFSPGLYVQIVGSFGCVVDGLPPVEVRQAALILASRYYKRGEAPFGVLQSTDLGQYTRLSASDPDVASLLAPWRFSSQWVCV